MSDPDVNVKVIYPFIKGDFMITPGEYVARRANGDGNNPSAARYLLQVIPEQLVRVASAPSIVPIEVDVSAHVDAGAVKLVE